MKTIFFFISLLLFKCSFSQNTGFKLFLIGDTGEDTALQSTMKNFLDTISHYPNSAVVFLGDNCYKEWILGIERGGFDSSAITMRRMGVQLDGLKNSKYKGSVFFIPGNHDRWNTTRMKRGDRFLKKEQLFIEDQLRSNSFINNNDKTFLPRNGNPIDAVDLNNSKLKLIFLDTHWLIMQKKAKKRQLVYEQIDSILNDAVLHHQQIVVTAHHPLYTIGSHSKRRFIPFLKFITAQDIYHPAYKDMRMRIDTMLHQKNYPIIFASGHDHVLEYFRKDSVQYVVSGAGSKTTRFSKKNDFNPQPGKDIPEHRIAKLCEGYFEVDFNGEDVAISIDTINAIGKELVK